MSTKNRTRRTTTATSAFPTKRLNKLTSPLSKKGLGNFQPGSLKGSPSETNAEKESKYITESVKKNEHPAFFPPEQDDIVNSLNYEGIVAIELQFYHFLTVTDCVLALSQTK